MIFDSLILAAVTEELQRTIVGGKVERIAQPAPREIVLTSYHAGQTHRLLLSADSQMARVHVTAMRRENPSQPPAFCALLRKHLDGAWINDVRMPFGFGERILHIHLKAQDGASHTLIAEVMGNRSNVILINGSGTVLGALKLIPPRETRARAILPGIAYVPPPTQEGKCDPFTPDMVEGGVELMADDAKAWLVKTYAGVSPFLAQEVVLRAQAPLTDYSLGEAIQKALKVVHTHKYAPRVWSDDRGVTQGAYPMQLLSVPAANQYPYDTISVALDNAASSVEQRSDFEQARKGLLADIHRALRVYEKEQEEITRGLQNSDRADEYQQNGELLLAAQHGIKKGEASVKLPDYYAPFDADGQPSARTIALEPTLDARENAERFFKKARKARDSREALTARLASLSDALATLRLAEPEAEALRTTEQIAGLREHIGLLLRERQQIQRDNEATATPFEGHKIKTFHTPDGWEILVGESAMANDYLTTRVAASSDLWLHVRAATSAHGVIRTRNRPEAVPPAVLQQAAEMVAARSEVKHSGVIPVDYTLKKYVRKPRKSAPGAVTYQNEKTLTVSGIHG